jgi:hypothetical protein
VGDFRTFANLRALQIKALVAALRWLFVTSSLVAGSVNSPTFASALRFTRVTSLTPKGRVIVNLGGEGEVAGVINQNLKVILDDGFVVSRGTGESLADLQKAGHTFVVSQNEFLPFASNSVDEVITNGVPLAQKGEGFLGPGIQPSEVQRILQSGGKWIDNGKTIYIKP